MNKAIKYIFGIFGTLVLAVIGNGLWELSKPGFQFIGKWTIELMGYLFLNFKDDIYKRASDGFHEYPSLFLMIMFIIVIATLYQMLITKHPQVRDKQTKWSMIISDFMRSKNGYYVTCFISISAIAFLYIFIVKYNYINQIVTYSEKSIRIVSPFINEDERILLKSEFARIKDTADFYSFKNHLESIAKINNLELGELNKF